MESLDFFEEWHYKDYKATRNKVKSEMVKLLREEQEKISVDCKKSLKILAIY